MKGIGIFSMKLKEKITLVAGSLMATALIISTVCTSIKTTNEISTLIDERATNNAKYFSAVINGWMIEKTSEVESTKAYVETITTKDNEEQLYVYLGDIVDSDEVVTDVYIGTDSGSLYDGSGWVPDEGWSCLTRSWYIGANETDGIYYGSPYLDDNTGDLCLSISTKCTFADGQKGVIGMDLNTTKLMENTDSLVSDNLSSDAYLIVSANDDSVIYSPNSEFLSNTTETKYIKDINDGKYIENVNTGKYFKDYDGVQKFVVSAYIEDNGWTVYLVEPKTVITEVVSETTVILAIASIVCLVLANILLIFVLYKLLSPLNKGVEALDTLAELDLREDEEVKAYEDRADEIGTIAQAISRLQSQLKTVVEDVKETSSDLYKSVKDVKDLSVNSSNGAGQINTAIGELAISSQSMAETVSNANQSVSTMGDAIDTIVSSVNTMRNSSDKTLKANKEAMEYMKKLDAVSEKSNQAVDIISQRIADCNDATASIQEATNMISAIASETNLLSLNASIEAARAGEVGRGFAVVASEIKDLSDQSDKSTKEIHNIISAMVDKVKACVEESDNLKKVIKEQMQLLEESKEKIQIMSQASMELSQESDTIYNETGTLTSLKEDVLTNITDLSAISEENAASAQEVSASCETIANAISGTEIEANQMETFAETLAQKISKFKA